MKKKEIFDKIVDVLDERQQKMLMKIKGSDAEIKILLTKLNKEVDKLHKIKGVLKLNKSIKKARKKFSSDVDKIYNDLMPSLETVIFHSLLEALDKLNIVFKTETKLVELTSERLGISIEEVKDNFSKNIKYNPPKFKEILKKEFVICDSRCSKFLNSVIEYNDYIINRKNLFYILQSQRNAVEIEGKTEILNYKADQEFLHEILKIIASGIITLDEAKTKFTKKEKTQFKYNFTRLKTIVLALEKEVIAADELIRSSKYKKLLLKSFKLENELPTSEVVESYTEYLQNLKKKRKLKTEYEMLDLEVI